MKADGMLRCGGVPRPGLAQRDGKGDWSGLEIEVCRAVAIAVLGNSDRVVFHPYESAMDWEAVRAGEDAIAFLTPAEIAAERLDRRRGPEIFIETHDLLVAASSPAKRAADLAGKGICFIIGTAVETSVETWFRMHAIEIVPNAFQEDGEMQDAYNVQRCAALAGESTALAQARLDGGVNHLESRLLPDHLAELPILATTSPADKAWAAVVDQVIAALLRDPGHDATIFRRTLGAGSKLKLEPRLNSVSE